MAPYSDAGVPADTSSTAAPGSAPSHDAQPSLPPSLENMRRSTITRDPVGPAEEKVIKHTPPPRPIEAIPSEPSPATRLAALARRERELRYVEDRARRTEDMARQKALSLLPPQQRAAYENAHNQQQVKAYLAESYRFAQSDPQSFELINALGQHGAVPQLIVEIFQRTGRVISHQEAAQAVEKRLERQLEAANATQKARALRARATGAAQRPSKPVDWNNTNRAPLTEAERYRRALAAMSSISRRNKK